MGEVDMLSVKSEVEFDGVLIEHEEHASYLSPPVWDALPRAQESKENIKSDALSTAQNSTSRLVQLQSPLEDAGFSASPMCPAPLCRQFWKAGNYEDELVSKSQVQNSKNYLHVHPKFLHSNATSHKWAFGAIAELLDNAIDEIQNGATFVSVDKILNPRDGSLALLFLDDGGGMGPAAIRRCMSFGFSDKESKSTIGRYGNGFKTSSMRLGADVIVFSRHVENRKLTQSIGLLSYTYLSRNGLDRIVVPMVDYEFNVSTNAFEPLYRFGQEHYESNISIILQWSPYSTEVELMKQFDDIGSHGTKVIVYNLWLTDDGELEFDFESDPQDIRLRAPDKSKVNSRMLISEDHIGNQYRYSLRVYMSILYLHIPPNFSITLCGKAVEHHRIAHDLKYPEFIMYRPQTGGTNEEVLTIIGFLKEAPHVYLHGFNVYHKNRLILPFWHVVSYADSRGRGVVGILEANFVEPTHNKQDFERTSLFQKLEARLKEMTWEYWDHRCGLIGYQVKKKLPVSVPSVDQSYSGSNESNPLVTLPARHFQNAQSSIQQQGTKRMPDDVLRALGRGKRQAKAVSNANNDGNSLLVQPVIRTMVQNKQEALLVVQETKKLREKCLELEKSEEELNYKVMLLTRDLEEAQQEFAKMSGELQALEVKGEKSFGNQSA
ncbi:protein MICRORCHIDIA 6-like [Silene latifolia]|uniref:protein MICRORCHIDIA 6-like n=1 Tax=Silene latifolia TaxID=37657 RepID=UPI003D7892B1